MVEALAKLGYHNPSPVQLRVIPKALRGESLVCQSETGSGKTHAYLVPIVDRLDPNKGIQSIVIAPSRELARQVYEFARALLSFFPGLKVRLLTSETDKTSNEEGLDAAPQLVIGTPGRLEDVLAKGYAASLKEVRTVVLDEAQAINGFLGDHRRAA